VVGKRVADDDRRPTYSGMSGMTVMAAREVHGTRGEVRGPCGEVHGSAGETPASAHARMPNRPDVAPATYTAATSAASAATGLRKPCAGDQRQRQQNRNCPFHLSLLTAEHPHN
jgi:hypothetical protein